MTVPGVALLVVFVCIGLLLLIGSSTGRTRKPVAFMGARDAATMRRVFGGLLK